MEKEEIEFFDRLAPEWDANEVRSTPDRVKKILGKLGIEKGMKVLDLGTGTGVLVPYLSEMVGPEGEVKAIDLSEGMLKIARQKYGKLPNVEFLKLDFEEEQIPGIYDIVMMYCVYPHLHTPFETIEWIFKMNMADNGRIVIAFPSDEKFINNIHHERGSDSDHLLPAPKLAEKICSRGMNAEVLAYNDEEYIIQLSRRES